MVTQERLYCIEEGLRTLRQLKQQLEENGASFQRAVDGGINAVYQKGVAKALRHCNELEKALLRLRQEEQVRLLSGM